MLIRGVLLSAAVLVFMSNGFGAVVEEAPSFRVSEVTSFEGPMTGREHLIAAIRAQIELAQQANANQEEVGPILDTIYRQQQAIRESCSRDHRARPVEGWTYYALSYQPYFRPATWKFTGWDFSNGNSWFDGFWTAGGCEPGTDTECSAECTCHRGCCMFWSSLMLAGYQCYLYQALLSPFMPCHYSECDCCTCYPAWSPDREKIASYLKSMAVLYSEPETWVKRPPVESQI